jgi:hypothetical protein
LDRNCRKAQLPLRGLVKAMRPQSSNMGTTPRSRSEAFFTFLTSSRVSACCWDRLLSVQLNGCTPHIATFNARTGVASRCSA